MHIRSPSTDNSAASVGGGISDVRAIPVNRSHNIPQYSGESLVTVGI